MAKLQINTDEAVELDITAPAGRSFDLDIDLHKELTGDDYRLQVKDASGQSVLSFALNNGIVKSGQKLVFSKTYQQMTVATGVYAYDLVEVKATRMDNLAKGNFIIIPSISS